MADNTTFNPGVGGDTYRAEDRGGLGVKYPVSLIDVGGTAGPEALLGDSGVTLPASLRSEQTDDAAFSPGTSVVLMVGATFDDTTPDSVNEGDGGALRMSANRNLYVMLRDGAGNERGLNVDASGNITANITGTVTVGSHAVTNAGIFATQSVCTNEGVFAVQETGAALTALQLLDNLVLAEDAAHSSGDPGVQILAVRKGTPANVSNTDGDYEPLQVSAGRLWTSAVIDTALPAGSNTIGSIDTIATSIVPGVSATHLGKAVDSASGGTDTGVAILAVRDDSLSTLTPAEGDYTTLRVSSTGALHVTGGGGGTQYNIDDVGGSTDTGTLLLAIRDDSLTTLTPADGDYVGLRVSSTGALHVTGGGGGTEYSEDAATPATIVGTATMMERDDALSTLTPIEGDWASLRCNSVGALWTAIDGTVTVGSHHVTNAGTFVVQAVCTNTGTFATQSVCTNGGTFVVQENGGALTALQLIDDTIFVDDAAFTPGTSKISAVGFLADETATDSVDEGDVGIARMTLDRKQHVVTELEGSSFRDAGTARTPKFAIIDCASSGDNTLIAAVASRKIRVLSVFLMASAAVTIRFESGAGGTALTGQMQVAANGGFALNFNPVGHFETAVNTLLNLELSGAISVDGCITYVEVA